MKMENKEQEHTFKSIKDIFKVIDKDNIENFLKDFVKFSYIVIDMTEKYGKDIDITAMQWTNDGVNEITGISVTEKQNNNE